MGKPLPLVSFGRKLLDHVKEFAREKEYHGLSLSSLMYIINYYRKYGFRHLPKLTGDVQYEDEKIKQLADNNLNFKFSDDVEMEDFMWIEIIERMLEGRDTEIKQRELKKYWTKRGLFYEDSTEDEKNNTISEMIKFYNENYEGSQIGEFILELEKQGFSTQRVQVHGKRKVERQSKRQMMKTMMPKSDKETSWNEGFKMSYSFANEDMPSRDDVNRNDLDLDFDLSQLDEIDNEIDNLGDSNKTQNGGSNK